MDDLKALKEVVMERAETLYEVRARKIDWQELSAYPLSDLIKGAYLDGVRDTLDYQEVLLEGEAEA